MTTEDTFDVPSPIGESFETIGELAPLFEALAKAQSGFETIDKDKRAGDGGPVKYKYATLAGTIEAVRGSLNAQGLCIMQVPWLDGEYAYVRTILAHASGASIRVTSRFMARQEGRMSAWQALGSAITYCRRYTLQGLLGAAPDDDDDGASAPDPAIRRGPPPVPQRQAPPPPKPAPKPEPKPVVPQKTPSQTQAARPAPSPPQEDNSPEAVLADMAEAAQNMAEAQEDIIEPHWSSEPYLQQEIRSEMVARGVRGAKIREWVMGEYGLPADKVDDGMTVSRAKALLGGRQTGKNKTRKE